MKTKIGIFFIIVIFTIIYVYLKNVNMELWDAGWYINIGNPCFENGEFMISEFPKTYRGCLFPIFLQVLKNSFIGLKLGYSISMGIVLASLFVFVLPALLGNKTKGLKFSLSILGVFLIYIYIWGDSILYPLSDLPALFLLFSGLSIMFQIPECNYKYGSLLAILAGMLFYASYNTRVIYFYGTTIAIVALLIVVYAQGGVKQCALIIIGLLFGASVTAIPQCIVNYTNEGCFVPKVYTENYQNKGQYRNLKLMQIEWGLKWPRYETYNGDMTKYKSAAVYFIDKSGEEILKREGIEKNINIEKWFELWRKYPLDMIGIYTRHFISGLTPYWNSVYISDIYINPWGRIVVSIFLWMVALTSLVSEKLVRRDLMRVSFMSSIIIPALLQTFGAVELRFLLPMYVLLYGYLALGIDYSKLYDLIRVSFGRVLLIMGVISFLWISVLGDILAGNAEQVILINNALR